MTPLTHTLSLLAVLAYTSTCIADVWTVDPTANSLWTIGEPVQIRWRLSPPTAKTDIATIFLVGGDSIAYKRLEVLGKDVHLGDHALTVPKVPSVTCGSSCAIEILIENGPGKGDYYTHNFTISAAAGGASAASSSAADKSTTVSTPGASGSTQNAATPNGPITIVQNAAKGAQSQPANANGATNIYRSGVAMALAVGAAAAAATMNFF
ncbi:hypothetical protein BGZ58_005578 [Dissophora ornata]|nr:hypothetical protein BGZ58_005578 [Dissophora ornata]